MTAAHTRTVFAGLPFGRARYPFDPDSYRREAPTMTEFGVRPSFELDPDRLHAQRGRAACRNGAKRKLANTVRILVLTLIAACAGGGGEGAGPEAVTPPTAEPDPVPPGRVPPPGPYAPGFDALSYDISLTLPTSGDRITGRTAIEIARTPESGRALELDLVGLRATRVTISVRGTMPRLTTFRQADGKLQITVPPEVRTDEPFTVEVEYEGVPDDGLILKANVHGEAAVFADNWPDRARFWFPSFDHPSDKARVRFRIEAPAGWQVIANGERTDGGTLGEPADSVWIYEVRVPIPTYTMVIGATSRFAISTIDACAAGGRSRLRQDGCVVVSSWTFPQDSANGARIFRRAGDMVRHYTGLFGAYPYHKLAHVQSATRFGGMENVGAIFYSEQAIANGTLGEVTVAHETAHQWFGDAVTEARWNHLWLSEGFATYFGMQYFEQADGVARFRELLAESRQGYLDSDVTDLAMVDTMAVPENDLFALLNANSYNKGGQVLHMLRGLLGDDVFFGGIRGFFTRHEHGTALTADLERALEQASGRDLGWFFDQWAYRPGHPVFRVSWTWDANAREAVVTLEQTQKDMWPTFRAPVELAFETPGGVERRTGEVVERTTVLRFPLPQAPTAVTLDPDGWLLKEIVS
jgi:aminopeptidase N